MFCVPDFYPGISLKLSRVLEEIGVNETVVTDMRRSALMHGSLQDITSRMQGSPFSTHSFGSSAEGTTTYGLQSDTDLLVCDQRGIVIQDMAEWEQGLMNLLMIQDETTPPGYCMLQEINSVLPFAVNVMNEDHVRYKRNKVLLKNTKKEILKLIPGAEMNGPAGTYKLKGFSDLDLVIAFPFKNLPQFLSTWLQQQAQQGKISQDMKRYIESKPCFVVGVGRIDSSFQEVQWRISTSYAERCLMFSLNITQIQCYVLLKLILKKYLTHHQEKHLSSFMCKNILLLCIRKTHPSKWCPENLLSVLTLCLLQLKRSVQHGYCPHFIISENNLLAGKLTSKVKSWLLDQIQYICETHGGAFLGVKIDGIGRRLVNRLNNPNHRIIVNDMDRSAAISGLMHYSMAELVGTHYTLVLKKVTSGNTSFIAILTTLLQLYHHGSFEQAASRLLTPLFCSSMGSVIASRDIQRDHSVSQEALAWLSLGLNSDVASSRLKLASVFYCIGDFSTTETILCNIEQTYDLDLVKTAFFCYQELIEEDEEKMRLLARYARFNDYRYFNIQNEHSMRHIVAYCVCFIREEVHCLPTELQYEMFRSFHEDRSLYDSWMDWAVVESLPYLYFLQYKTYGHLQKYDEQQQAFNNLVKSRSREDNYAHKETALNLLGQIYQQENRYTEAFLCYMASLKVRPTNNAAKLHLWRLLYAMNTN